MATDQGVGGLIVHLSAEFIWLPPAQGMADGAFRVLVDKLAAVFVLVAALAILQPPVIPWVSGVGVSDVK